MNLDETINSVVIDCMMFAASEHDTRSLQILINGVPVFMKDIHDIKQVFDIKIPERIDRTMVRIEFLIGNATSPFQLGVNIDLRKLGIGLQSMTFK